jgi:cell division protein FtsW (lipid II flippase)
MSRRVWPVVELASLVAAIAIAWVVGSTATSAWIARVETLPVPHPDFDVVRGQARTASLYFTLGVAALGGARAIGWRRAREPIAVPWLLPAAVFACLLGLAMHHGTVETTGGAVVVPTAAGFAQGFLLGAIVAAGLIVAPVDVVAIVRRLQLGLAIAIAGIFLALAVAGSGPGGSGTKINLGPVQPIEIVKPLAVAFLAGFLGARTAKLRWHRRRFLGLRWPRLELLIPALVALIAIFGGLFVVGDFGPVLLLAGVFLAMFYAASRATGWVLAALAIVTLVFAIVAKWPGIVGTERIVTRVEIWHDPWTNGLSHGHQVGEGLWGIAAGGATGQGLAQAAVPLPPAAKTDLALVPLIEQLGVIGLFAYLGLLGAIAFGGLSIAARGRTPEGVLLAGGLAMLLVLQWLVIHAGTFAALPLTGIVVPFVSTGRTSMVVFVAIVGLLVRLALDGRARAAEPALEELHAAARSQTYVAVGLLAIGAMLAIRAAILQRDELSTRGIAVTLRDGTIVVRQNPRLLELVAQLRRGTIADRHGVALATSETGKRSYPLRAAFGTLLGSDPSPVLRPPWALERVFDHRLRGYSERTDGPSYRELDRSGKDTRDVRVAWPDLRPFARLLSLSRSERATAIRAIDQDLASRSVKLTIDARLQTKVVELLRGAVTAKRPAAIAVVIDVDTGQVLARAQAPDLDPSDPAWAKLDEEASRRFHGAYGEWSDKTGLHGGFQAGSVAKLFVALAAVRGGHPVSGGGCAARSETVFACTERDGDGPSFTQPGWTKPIHDHVKDPTHGRIDLVTAIAVSCNVYFGQLGLELGPGPLAELRQAGVDIGYAGATFSPGAPGSRALASTAFGQGAMAMSAMQAARLVAAIAGGGHYRRCPPTMELGAACSDTALLADPGALAPVIAGMRKVMTEGTGRGLRAPEGIRVYGKTGTADAPGFAGEEAFGIPRGSDAEPHSWFVAFAEPASTSECSIVAPRRLAIAVVVPRGGAGALSAGPLTMKILGAARELGYLR